MREDNVGKSKGLEEEISQSEMAVRAELKRGEPVWLGFCETNLDDNFRLISSSNRKMEIYKIFLKKIEDEENKLTDNLRLAQSCLQDLRSGVIVYGSEEMQRDLETKIIPALKNKLYEFDIQKKLLPIYMVQKLKSQSTERMLNKDIENDFDLFKKIYDESQVSADGESGAVDGEVFVAGGGAGAAADAGGGAGAAAVAGGGVGPAAGSIFGAEGGGVVGTLDRSPHSFTRYTTDGFIPDHYLG